MSNTHVSSGEVAPAARISARRKKPLEAVREELEGKMSGGARRRGGGAATVLGLLLLVASGAMGQDIKFGIRAGLNVSGVIYQDAGAAGGMVLKQGIHLGAGAALRVSRFLSVETAVLISQDGFQGEGGHPGEFQMDYLELPIMLKVRIPTRVSPHLLVGLTAGYMVRCRLTGVAFVETTTCDDRLVGTRWRSFDVGGLFGLGATLPTRMGRFGLDAFLSLGIRDLKEDLLPPGSARRGAIRVSMTWFPASGERS